MTFTHLTPDPRITESGTALRILDVAAQLFMQRGYRAVSINDVIRAAGVTKPTLYYYFSDKEDLFVQMGLRVLATMCQPLAEAASAERPARERLQTMAAILTSGYEGDIRMMRHEMMEHLSAEARQRLHAAFYHQLFAPLLRVMNDARAEGLVRADLSPGLLSILFLSLCETFHELTPAHPLLQWSDISATAPALDAALFVDCFLYGVAHPSHASREVPRQ